MTAAETEIGRLDKSHGLTRTERVNVRIVELWHSVPALSAFSVWMSHKVARKQVEMIVDNFVEYHNFDRVGKANFQNGVLICANHRSYIDNFAVAQRAMRFMPRNTRIIAPARTEGLFDKPWSVFINLFLTWMNMYPPVVRSSRGTIWGKRVIEILTDLLRRGKVAVFIHPEGGRNKGNDPYKLMPARPGLGRIIHQTNAEVFPVFLHGFPRTPGEFLRANYRKGARQDPLVFAVMGESIDFSAERAQPASPRLFKEIAEKLNKSILDIAEIEKEIRERAGKTLLLEKKPDQPVIGEASVS